MRIKERPLQSLLPTARNFETTDSQQTFINFAIIELEIDWTRRSKNGLAEYCVLFA